MFAIFAAGGPIFSATEFEKQHAVPATLTEASQGTPGFDRYPWLKTNSAGIDFESDEPLVCPADKKDGEACESCQ